MKFENRTKKKIAVKEKQEKILNQKVYLESIISSMTDTLIVINPDSTIRSVNKAALDLLGYEKDELIGQPIKKIFIHQKGGAETESRSILHEYFHKILEAGVAYNISLTFLTKYSNAIPVNFNGALMQENGKIIGIVGVARDMRWFTTIIRNLEQKESELKEGSKNLTRMRRAMLHIMDDLKSAKDGLIKALGVKTEFTGMVSHELRTPLTVIKEGASVLLDEVVGNINKEQKK